MQQSLVAVAIAAALGLAACDRAPDAGNTTSGATPPVTTPSGAPPAARTPSAVDSTGKSDAARTATNNATGDRIDAAPRTTPSSPGNVDAPALPASRDAANRADNAQSRVDPATRADATTSGAGERAAQRGDVAGDRAANAADRTGDKARDALSSAGRAIDDGALTARVKAALVAADDVPATAINVDTTRGRVSLTGRVANQQQKDRAVRAARGVEGVQSVDDGKLAVGG
jgi:osmotically-inducible protein OsmY